MQWAHTRNIREAGYVNLPAGDRGVNLKNAIKCYEAALRVFTESDYPYNLNIVQENLKEAQNHPSDKRSG